jgi:hypothetical protein
MSACLIMGMVCVCGRGCCAWMWLLCTSQFSAEFRRACDAQLRQLQTALKGCAGTTQPISNFSVFVRVPSSLDAGELCLQRVAFRAGDDDAAGELHTVLCAL